MSEIQAETHKPALRLPEGLFVVPNPNVEAPVVLHPKPELAPNPSGRVIEKYTWQVKHRLQDTGKQNLTSSKV